MRISYLEEFVEVAYCLNFSKAAKNLGTSQSSISKHIQALESQYGVALFERDTNSVELTSFGIALFQEAAELIEHYKTFESKMDELSRQYRRSLVVGGMHYNPRAMKLLKSAQLQSGSSSKALIPLHYKSTLADPILTSLRKKEVDIAIMPDEPILEKDGSLFTVKLFDDPLMVLLEKEHPLAQREALSLHELLDQTIVKPSGSYFILGNELLGKLFEKHGLSFRSRVAFVKRITDFMDIDLAGGVTFIESGVTENLPPEHHLVAIPLVEEDALFSIDAVCLKSNAEAVTFLESLAACVKSAE